MKYLILAVVTLGSLCLPCSALAAFMDAEVASLVRLHNAREHTEEAVMHHLSGLLSAYTTSTTRRPLGQAMKNAVLASRELNLSMALLVGVVTEQVDTPPYRQLAASPRSERLRLAWWRLDRFLMFAKSAQEALTSASELLVDPSYQERIRRTRDIWLRQAINEASAVDRGLAYGDPRPTGYPKIIGPHGDYDRTQWFLWRSQWYAHDALDTLLEVYLRTSMESSTAIGDVFMRLFNASRLLMQSLEAVAGLSWTTEQRRSSQFFRVLGVTKTLTDEELAPKRWMEAFISPRTHWLPQVEGRPAAQSLIYDALIRIADAWKHADMAAWETMEFPGCEPAAHPEGCGGTAKR